MFNSRKKFEAERERCDAKMKEFNIRLESILSDMLEKRNSEVSELTTKITKLEHDSEIFNTLAHRFTSINNDDIARSANFEALKQCAYLFSVHMHDCKYSKKSFMIYMVPKETTRIVFIDSGIICFNQCGQAIFGDVDAIKIYCKLMNISDDVFESFKVDYKDIDISIKRIFYKGYNELNSFYVNSNNCNSFDLIYFDMHPSKTDIVNINGHAILNNKNGIETDDLYSIIKYKRDTNVKNSDMYNRIIENLITYNISCSRYYEYYNASFVRLRNVIHDYDKLYAENFTNEIRKYLITGVDIDDIIRSFETNIPSD